MTADPRAERLGEWVRTWLQRQNVWSAPEGALEVVSGDASFRRYFRQRLLTGSVIAVDAPLAQEDCMPFVAIARALHEHGLCVPEVLAWSSQEGFMLLTDLGDQILGPELAADTVNMLYGAALTTLVQVQSCPPPAHYFLPHYDRTRLLNEMSLLTEWFIPQYLGIALSAEQSAICTQQFELISEQVLAQPIVFVHRDYHSRNLMLAPTGELGILDFQDAVTGPITYDLASLLRDAYVSWPEADVRRWVQQYRTELLSNQMLDPAVTVETFQTWFDWVAAQRHLKVAGIFARLYLRDGKSAYLANIPLVLRYLLDEIAPYKALQPLHELLLTLLPTYLARYPAASTELGRFL
jgi:aminoglycoside/choline kinase family phosphotransferase